MRELRPREGDPASSTPADGTPLPTATGVEARFVEVWRAFLDELATDAHKAHAAAIAYRELDADARDSWIRVLEQDARQIDAPPIAIYAPLLAVETDPERRTRIVDAIGEIEDDALPRVAARALGGDAGRGERVAVLVMPLYLSFVQVLAIGFRPGAEFTWIRHEPILVDGEAPRAGEVLAGAELDVEHMNTLVDELAHTVLGHQRSGKAVPDVLRIFAHLFGPASSVLAGD